MRDNTVVCLIILVICISLTSCWISDDYFDHQELLLELECQMTENPDDA